MVIYIIVKMYQLIQTFILFAESLFLANRTKPYPISVVGLEEGGSGGMFEERLELVV